VADGGARQRAVLQRRWAALVEELGKDGLTEADLLGWLQARAGVSTNADTMVDWLDQAGSTGVPDADGDVHTPDQDGLSGGRYLDLGRIGLGGMGEVRRVLDRRLNRRVAMKVLRDGKVNARAVHRFVEEAQATAQLQHPGIVPTYELGELEDGRPFFTMKEVDGTTLEVLIAQAHEPGDGSEAGRRGSEQRLLEVFRRVCEAVAYAHVRGVVHRDLKPANVMVGAFGEVQVMDWGLAKVIGGSEQGAEDPNGSVVTSRSRQSMLQTRVGAVVGTPAYMAPEQVRRGAGSASAQMDVYALGAMLFEILVGRLAFPQTDLAALFEAKLQGPVPEPVVRLDGRAVAEELRSVCVRALQRDPALRYADAAELGAEVALWLEGARRRERARRVVDEARALVPEIGALRERSVRLRSRARALLDVVPAWSAVSEKREGWTLDDESSVLAQEAEVRELLYAQMLQTALNHDPELSEAHHLLAEHFRALHTEAERRQDSLAAARYETSLRHHDRGRHAGYLRGDGSVTLVTEPGDATIDLYRYELRDRRMIAVFDRHLGRSPLHAVELPRGAYVLRLRRHGFMPVNYPIFLERGAHWEGVAPGGTGPAPIRLPRDGEICEEQCYVPAGWGLVGGDQEALASLPRRWVWQDAFVIQRHPVRNREYLEFLNDLVDAGREEEALSAAPRERAGTVDQYGALIYGRNERGHFELRPDGDGDVWGLDWPCVMIDWHGAMAYAAWRSERDGLPWRLPTELEWEKAARGVDGRLFPWGNFLDATFACMRASHKGRWMLQGVDSYPVDESPYGVRGMAGNVGDWCLDGFADQGAFSDDGRAPTPADGAEDLPRVHRGGWWSGGERTVRAATRLSSHSRVRTYFLGMRLLRPLP
jgi:formylglycine-generating enzyme required for sulfatase activity/tRNA A-37 threonylcarbamoyl transferase component Bud32